MVSGGCISFFFFFFSCGILCCLVNENCADSLCICATVSELNPKVWNEDLRVAFEFFWESILLLEIASITLSVSLV